MGSIEDLFDQLDIELENYFNTALQMVAKGSIEKLAEAWAYLIIDILTSYTLEPLSEATVVGRQRRNISVLDPDIPLIETGEWITYIEFRVRSEYDLYYLEVGVFDDSTGIGHDKTVTPAYIACANEYGIAHIPARAPFAISEMQVETHIDRIITSAWRDLATGNKLDKTVSAIVTRKVPNSYGDFHKVGRITRNGTKFKFEWDGV